MRLVTGFFSFVLAMSATPAAAAWMEASSDHFVIYSDSDEKQLREFATGLERFDKGMRVLRSVDRAEDRGRRSTGCAFSW